MSDSSAVPEGVPSRSVMEAVLSSLAATMSDFGVAVDMVDVTDSDAVVALTAHRAVLSEALSALDDDVLAMLVGPVSDHFSADLNTRVFLVVPD